MLSTWLSASTQAAPNALLEVEFLEPGGAVADDRLMQYLGQELSRNYLEPGALAAVFADLAMPGVAEMLRENVYPAQVAVRHGDFGEIVTGAMFRTWLRWCVPILKLRFKQRPDQPVQGVDGLAFRLRQNPPAVAVPEVKTRTTRKLDIGEEAVESLDKVLGRLSQSIWFVTQRLHASNNILAKRIAPLIQRTDVDIRRHIVLVHDTATWSDEVLTRLAARVIEPTRVTVIRVPQLKDLIAEAYSAAETEPGRRARERANNA